MLTDALRVATPRVRTLPEPATDTSAWSRCRAR